MSKDVVISGYPVIEALGAGESATTYLASDPRHEQCSVALKLFTQEWSKQHPEQIDQEFEILASLSHPYLAGVLDFGRVSGQSYLVTEFIKGEALLEFLAGRDLNTVLWYFAQLLEALDYLYFRNVVHLDLKPANILVAHAREGVEPGIRLIDFGLAALSTGKSQSGQAIGSPPYTAPEFALRRGVDTRSDLYSVGVLLFEALTGKLPFTEDNAIALLNQQINTEAKKITEYLPDINPRLAEWIAGLLARDPEKRPQSARQALEQLQDCLGEKLRRSPIAPLPCFEDPDFLFRPDEFASFWQQFSQGPERWLVLGKSGQGKSFFASWLQRKLWQAGQKVLLLRGENLPLLNQDSISDDEVLIIDDAHEGPIRAWLDQSEIRRGVFIIASDAEVDLRGTGKVLTLSRLKKRGIRELLEQRFTEITDDCLQAWWKKSQGIPASLIQIGCEYLRAEVLVFDGGSWRFSPAGFEKHRQGSVVEERPEDVLEKIIRYSLIAVDSNTLAGWSGQSQQEVELCLANLTRAGRLSRSIIAGQIAYQATMPLSMGIHSLAEGQVEKILDKISWQGRFAEGLDLLASYYGNTEQLDFQTRILKAEFLTGASRYAEVFQVLNDAFVAELSGKQLAVAQECLGKSYLFTGQHPSASSCLAAAEKLYKELEDSQGLAKIYLHLGILQQREGQIEIARDYYQQTYNTASQAPEPELIQGVAQLNLGNLHYDRGEYNLARPFYEMSLSLLDNALHGPVLAQALLNFAHLHFYQGRTFEAEQHCIDALRLAISYRFLLTQGYALLLLALIDERRGNPERQGARLAAAIEIFAKAEMPFEWVQAKINEAYYLERQSSLGKAEESARLALQKALALKAGDLLAKARLVLGKILKNTPKFLDAAGKELAMALEHFTTTENQDIKWQCEFERAEAERLHGHQEAAEHFYAEAEQTLQSFLAAMSPELQEAYLRDKKLQMIATARKKIQKGH